MGKIWFALALVLFSLCGCSDNSSLEVVPERDEKHFNRGMIKLSEQRYDEALGAFLKVIEKRPEAPESHLEAGRLYQDYLGDPIAAIYHYRKYLEYRPDSDQSPLVRQMIESAKKDFARQLPGQPYDDEIERLDLLEIIESVRAENLDLKRQLAAARGRVGQLEGAPVSAPTFSTAGTSSTRTPPASTSSRPVTNTTAATSTSAPRPSTATANTRPSASAASPAPSGMRLYTVEAGDTLSRISTKFYGSSARWQDIFNANRDTLASPHSLRQGQQIKIPPE
ncbi:LysM peptidoglycan-binding domain-containing protein [Ruficoccus amylovorans]|uniref:LysM peptidoglycan-binding domain-containing protein n=1 Tax=Ruficoccus amylovorans TaxID=1804625 RepID=A0A842HDW4_9BACT|nr:LysM peptidoglycan-binding domain-containing protein [Ruficoccus amylovorans]MBC2593724.1 LysM peptidoglycan-binding domain-containing protein [Ruficoccus amylovorans]